MDFRLNAHDPRTGDFLYTLPRPAEVQIGDVFGDRGTLELTYSTHQARAVAMPTFLEVQAQVQFDGGAWDDVGPALIRLGGSHEDTDRADMRKVQFVGRDWLLGRARVGAGDLPLIDGKRPFYQATAGQILRSLILEAQDRGAADGIELGPFTNTTDSAGNAWTEQVTIYYSPGLPIGDVLANLVEQGVCDYRMEGRTLHVYEPETTLGRDLTTGDNPVRVHGAVTEAPVKYTLEDLANSALLIGEDGFQVEVDNPSAPDDYGRLEITIEQGGVNQEGTARTLIDAELQRGSREIREITRTQHAAGARFLPYRDYRPGDFVQAFDDGQWERYRVREIQLVRDAGGWTVHTVLNDRLKELLLKLAEKTNGITNGSRGSGGDGTQPAPPQRPGVEPAAPVGLVIDQQVYLDDSGTARGVITAGWGEVTESTAGLAIDIGGYELWWRENDTYATWTRATATSGDTTVDQSPVILTAADGSAMEYQWRVRAVAQASNRPGPWSNVVTLTMTQDTTPPPPPSAPVVSTGFRIVTVEWDGVDENGQPMPRDFSRVRVYLAAAEDMVGARLSGSLAYPGSWNSETMPADVPVWVAMSAVDRVGNESAMTAAVSVTPRQLVDDEKIREELDGIDDTIQDAVDDLHQDIENIVVDANGNATFWLPTEPDETTEPTPKTGDIWFNTSDGNKLHRFDGQGWVSASDSRFDTIRQAQDDLAGDIEEVRLSANGKSRIVYSTRPPSSSDEGSKDDVWWVGLNSTPNANVIVAGDSITEGTGASDTINRWQSLLQRRINPNGPDYPFIPSWPNTSAPGMPVSRGGAVRRTSTGATRWGLGWRTAEIYDHTTDNSEPGYVEYSFTGTSAQVMFASASATGIATITVDAQSPVEFDTNTAAHGGVSNYGLTWETGQLEDGPHTIRVDRSAGSATGRSVWAEGALTFRRDESAHTRLLDSARHGIRSDYWSSVNDAARLPALVGAPATPGAFQGVGEIDLVVLGYGTNDYAYDVGKSAFKSNYQDFIYAARAAGFSGQFLLLGMYMGKGRDAEQWDQYHQAMQELAEADSAVDYIDLRELVPGPDTRPDLFADSLHPNDDGHATIADALEFEFNKRFPSSWLVVNQFIHDGQEWVETEVDGQVVANLDAGKITAGYIDSARIEAGSLSADKLLIGTGAELFPDPSLSMGGDYNPWVYEDGVLTKSGAGVNHGAYFEFTDFAVTPGSKLFVKASAAADEGTVRVYLRQILSGGILGSRVYYVDSVGSSGVSGEIVLADDVQTLRLGLFTRPDVPASAVARVANLSVKEQVGSTLIQDGAITTDKILAGAITAESGIIASLDAGTITSGTIDSARIAAGSITADKLLIGSLDELAPSPATYPGEWTLQNGASFFGWANSYDGTGLQLVSESSALGPFRDTNPGRTVQAEAWVGRYSGMTEQVNLNIRIYFYDKNRAYITSALAVSGTGALSGTATAPADAVFVRIGLLPSMPFVDGWLSIRDMHGRPQIGATLIEDGAVTTDKILANAITAGKIAALAIEADHIAANAVQADKIDAGAIDGKIITGATVRTSASGARVQMNPTGLYAYNPSNEQTFSINANTGAVGITGNLTQRNSYGSLQVGPSLFNVSDGGNGSPAITLREAGSTVWGPAGILLKESGTDQTLNIQGPLAASGQGAYLALPVHGSSRSVGIRRMFGDGDHSYLSLSQDRGVHLQSSGGNAYLSSRHATLDYSRAYVSTSSDGQITLRTQQTSKSSVRGGYINLDTNGVVVTAGNGASGVVARNLYLNAYGTARFQSFPTGSSGSAKSYIRAENNGEITIAGDGGGIYYRLTSDGWHRASGIYGQSVIEPVQGMTIDNTGKIGRYGSSRRWKTAIETISTDDYEDALLSVEYKSWIYTKTQERSEELRQYRADNPMAPIPEHLAAAQDDPARQTGMIAEELHDAGVTELVGYDQYGRPDSIIRENFGMALVPIIKRLRDRVDALETQLGATE